MKSKPDVLLISNRHPTFDCRIFYKEAVSLAKIYNCYVISGGNSGGMLTTMGNELRPKGVYKGVNVLPYPYSPVKLNIFIRAFRKFFPCIFNYIYNIFFFKKLIKICKENNIEPSIIHYHDLDFSNIAKKLQLYFNCKLIFDCHEFYFSYFLRSLNYKNLKKASKSLLMLKDAVRNADTTISVTKHLDNIISLMNNNKTHHLIYNCSDLPLIDNKRNKNEKIVLLHEGYMIFSRGFKLMLELFTDPFFRENVKLKILGSLSEELLEYYNEKKSEYNLDDSMIEFTGWIDYENIHKHLTGTIGIMFFEKTFNAFYSMPNKLFNYIKAGIPILTIYCSEISDLIETNKIGFIVEREITSIKNGINEIITNYDSYKENVLNIQHQYSWENEEKKLFKIYENLLN